VWCTLIERDVDVDALGVLSLRVGLALAAALAPLADVPLWLKWPNDLLLAPRTGAGADWSRARKLAGVLVETRWRQVHVEYVAIGVGINVSSVDPPPHVHGGRGSPAASGLPPVALPPGALPPGALPPGALPPGALPPGVSRARVLQRVLPALRAAARARGVLRDEEGDAWAARDAAVGRPCLAPRRGHVLGVARDGALRIGDAAGEHQCRSGSLELDLPPRGDG
jgi:biotin-(acetyl-CoA carboxylase) ligase